ncbi:MAG: EAL domain-containing protein [Thalassotalea sp.]|nr:EAL domain-containing protein [Thalassotalea sp.]
MAEKLSRFNDLSSTLLQKSCRFMTKSTATKGMLLSVNVAANEIAHEDFFFSFIETIKLSGFALNQVQVEITETSLIENFECAKLNIEQLKRSGIRIALDDFGAGFSSLTYLNKLALNTIKLDKSLTHNLDNEKNRIIVRSIIEMAHKLDITVVPEGVEEVEQVTCLKDLACDLVQGFYYAKPMSERDFSELPGYLVN